MKKKEPCDNTLVRKVKSKGCGESYKMLSNRHEKLFYKICQFYMPVALAKGFKKSEILSDKDFVIFKAIRSYKYSKNTKFSTWLGNCAKYHCLSLVNSKNRYINSNEDLLTLLSDAKSKEEYSEDSESKYDKEYVFNILNNLKDKRISQVFKLRYFDEHKGSEKATWSFIAKKIKTSTQTAINLHQRGKKILRKKLEAIDFQDMI